VDEVALLLDGHSGEAVVGGIAEDDEDGFLLDVVGGVALLGQFGKEGEFGFGGLGGSQPVRALVR
jgi:hypothetical protein